MELHDLIGEQRTAVSPCWFIIRTSSPGRGRRRSGFRTSSGRTLPWCELRVPRIASGIRHRPSPARVHVEPGSQGTCARGFACRLALDRALPSGPANAERTTRHWRRRWDVVTFRDSASVLPMPGASDGTRPHDPPLLRLARSPAEPWTDRDNHSGRLWTCRERRRLLRLPPAV